MHRRSKTIKSTVLLRVCRECRRYNNCSRCCKPPTFKIIDCVPCVGSGKMYVQRARLCGECHGSGFKCDRPCCSCGMSGIELCTGVNKCTSCNGGGRIKIIDTFVNN